MKKTVLSIKKWGNSLGVRLPAAVANKAHLSLDQQVCIRGRNAAPTEPLPSIILRQECRFYGRSGHKKSPCIAAGAFRWWRLPSLPRQAKDCTLLCSAIQDEYGI